MSTQLSLNTIRYCDLETLAEIVQTEELTREQLVAALQNVISDVLLLKKKVE